MAKYILIGGGVLLLAGVWLGAATLLEPQPSAEQPSPADPSTKGVDDLFAGGWKLATGGVHRECGEQAQDTPLSEMPYEFTLSKTEGGYQLKDQYCAYSLTADGDQLIGEPKRCDLPIGPGNYLEMESIKITSKREDALLVEMATQSTMDLRGEQLKCHVVTKGEAARTP